MYSSLTDNERHGLRAKRTGVLNPLLVSIADTLHWRYPNTEKFEAVCGKLCSSSHLFDNTLAVPHVDAVGRVDGAATAMFRSFSSVLVARRSEPIC